MQKVSSQWVSRHSDCCTYFSVISTLSARISMIVPNNLGILSTIPNFMNILLSKHIEQCERYNSALRSQIPHFRELLVQLQGIVDDVVKSEHDEAALAEYIHTLEYFATTYSQIVRIISSLNYTDPASTKQLANEFSQLIVLEPDS
ncbi:hypothetical protein BLNAU_444 [Blattamonas nauphoetae]|uniref:Uncharacterized protein n=1 Tax=Blattamonas nauphoetae TaxID=2049346 RepID=A0ABQ9YL97_9EUKA|nr:hypothetical protein BLNAU_444 [Blattamonas nauphoetae]